ncbi:MAG: beta-propeller domain-containing protein [Proteobacteria bacterium]|nr:beta-propeller domain-containing protein [Pseudomonadota bacterium]
MESNIKSLSHLLRLALVGSSCVGVAIMASLSGCGGGSSTAIESTLPPSALRATTEAGLTAYFREALGPASKSYLGTVWATDVTVAIASVAPAAAASTPIFSGTTLQETGVDEADLIKSDGTQVFSLDQASANDSTRNLLRRLRLNAAAADAALTAVGSLKIPFSGDIRGTGLYLDSERRQLAAVGEGNTGLGIYSIWFSPQSWGQGVTEVALIDSADSEQMLTRRTLRMDARLIGSRRLGSTLYLVLRSYPQVPGLDPSWPTTSANNAVVNALQASQLLPTLSIDGGAKQPLVDASSCFTQENNSVKSADVVTVVGIDLASATHRHAAICFTGGTEAFYMSEQSLYLATTRSSYTYSGAFPVYSAQTNTDIHKFALNGLDIAYRGSGSVTGHLGFDQNRKSFRMGEYNGLLRVVTQTQTSWGGWFVTVASTSTTTTTPAATTPIDSPGRLTILQESAGALAVVGELPNAARPQPLGKPGEQLYASRFLGARGYLVTYRLTDPLYVLDLSNPADPKVAGELQVDGYSDYLFPLSETLLLGVGKDAQSDGTAGDGRFAWYQGVKISLIDVSDPAHPREAARSIIGRRGTDATVLHDHHGIALQTVGDTVRVSLPVSLHNSPPPPSLFIPIPAGALNAYFGYTRTELQRFEVSLGNVSLAQRPALVSSLPNERYIGNDRSLLWNNQVHYYQDGNWISAAW